MSARILLRAKWRTLANLRRSAQMGPKRFVVLLIMGLLVWVGIAAASHWFLGKVVAIELHAAAIALRHRLDEAPATRLGEGTVAALALDLPEYDADRIHHSRVPLADVRRVSDALLSMPRAQRAAA